MTTPSLVVCFSGRIGSGKSSVTERLAIALDWPRAGFGDYLRGRLAKEGGDPTSREALQDLGQLLVDADPDLFCSNVLTSGDYAPGMSMLLDGIRHVNIYTRIARLVAPSRAPLIHLAADDAQIRERVGGRQQGVTDLQRAQRHRVEADLAASLPAIADVVVDANADLADVLGQCLKALCDFGVSAEVILKARSTLQVS